MSGIFAFQAPGSSSEMKVAGGNGGRGFIGNDDFFWRGEGPGPKPEKPNDANKNRVVAGLAICSIGGLAAIGCLIAAINYGSGNGKQPPIVQTPAEQAAMLARALDNPLAPFMHDPRTGQSLSAIMDGRMPALRAQAEDFAFNQALTQAEISSR